MLFFCRWDDDDSEHASLLVDAKDDEDARSIAMVERGEEPDVVTAIPTGVFAADVFFEGDDAALDEADLAVEPFEHTIDALAALENGEPTDLEDAITETPQCAAEATDENNDTIRCELAAGHGGAEHRSGDFAWAIQ